MSRHCFRALDRVIDEVHALLDGWAADGPPGRAIDEDGMYVLRLAVHEWIANLVQHAYFPGPPEIVLAAEVVGDGVRCTVEDASAGFDFASQIDAQSAILDAPAPSERGRGLLMLITCTEALSFTPAGPGQRQTIAFTVRSGVAGSVLAPLFRPEDLADDYTLADDALADDARARDAFAGDAFAGDPFAAGALAGDGQASAAPPPFADSPSAPAAALPRPS